MLISFGSKKQVKNYNIKTYARDVCLGKPLLKVVVHMCSLPA